MTIYLYDLEHVCQSSAVLNMVRYHQKSQTLYVQTNTGQWYRYILVPKRVYDLLEVYKSYGAWWNHEVKAAHFTSSSLYAPQFKKDEPEETTESFENEEWTDAVDAKWSVVVEFSEPLTFTVRGDDVIDAVESVNTMLKNGGFDGKYKVREVKKQ